MDISASIKVGYPEERQHWLALALLLSLCLHLVVMAVAKLPEVLSAQNEKAKPQILVKLLPALPPPQAVLAPAPPPQPAPSRNSPTPPPKPRMVEVPVVPVPVPPPPKPSRPNRQIVDVGPEPPNDKTPPPDNDRFLAERNLRADKETVNPSEARTGSPAFPATPPPEPEKERRGRERKPKTVAKREETPPPAIDKPKEKAAQIPEPGTAPQIKNPPLPKPGLVSPEPLAPTGPGPGLKPASGPKSGPGRKPAKDPGVEIARRGKPGLSREDLQVNLADAAEADGDKDGDKNSSFKKSDLSRPPESDNGSVDFLPEIPRGTVTSLNAKKFTYAAFFNRMKRTIRFYWDPVIELKRAGFLREQEVTDGYGRSRGTRLVYSGPQLETRISVEVNRDGSVGSVEVVKSCGYPGVDATAVRAIRKAAPFFGVPEGILNQDGKFTDTWGFYIP